MSRLRQCLSIRNAALGAVLLAAGGCAMPEFLWRQSDDLVVAEVNEWLDLEPRQEQQLRERLQPWLEQVRRQDLPEIAAFLRGLADRIGPGFDLDDASWADRRSDRLYRDVARSFIPVIAPTLSALSERQRRHLAREIERYNEDYRAEYVDGRDNGKYALAERLIGALERWTGALEPSQRALVHRHVRDLPRTAPAWHRFRRQMQQRLLDGIEGGAAPAEIEQTLVRWWIGRGRDGDRHAIDLDGLRNGLHRLAVDLVRSLSAAQSAEARRRLRARAADLQAIADSATG